MRSGRRDLNASDLIPSETSGGPCFREMRARIFAAAR